MTGQVCVDASVLLSILLKDQLVNEAKQLWRDWIEEERELVSAPLFFAEVTSVLRHNVYFDRIKQEDGEEAFRAFVGIEEVITPPARDLQPMAWEMAKQFNLPRAYDVQYLAAAGYFDCDCWTADKRLTNAVPVPWLKWLGDFRMP